MNIFRKIGAVITSGVMAFILVAENTSPINTVSADNPDIPQLKSIDLDGFYGSNPYRYTGVLQKVMNIDIDYDGEKEVIAYYKGGCLENSEKTNIDAFYDIYDENSDTPQTVCKERISIHSHYETHIIKDNNNGKIFLGYIADDPSMAGLCTLYPDGESIMRLDSELYDSYMKNVTFLDEVAYGKGDIDGDADITISDASTILSCYAYNLAGLPLEINDIQKDAADMDKDGEITISDASTALSLYAESAAGLIDTLILPSTVKEDEINRHFLVTGNLESTFYLDIDNDGIKETIGRYDNTNLYDDSSKDINVLAKPYVFQVYDNGIFSGSFGFDPSGGMCYIAYFLVNDHNINQTYLASITHRCVAMYGYAVMSKEYPIVVGEAQPYILYINDTVNMESGEPVTTETIEIDSKSATRQEILDYINNLEIISPYKDEDESLSIFEYIFDTYSEYARILQ